MEHVRNIRFADPDYVKRWKPKDFVASKTKEDAATPGKIGFSELKKDEDGQATLETDRGKAIADLYRDLIGIKPATELPSGDRWSTVHTNNNNRKERDRIRKPPPAETPTEITPESPREFHTPPGTPTGSSSPSPSPAETLNEAPKPSLWDVHAPMPARHMEDQQHQLLEDGFFCDVCNSHVDGYSLHEHSASTLHLFNVRAAQGEYLVRSHVEIPESNRGYQMLRDLGWSREQGVGLGSQGQGRLEPVPTVFKKSRSGIGGAGKRERPRVTHFSSHVEPLDLMSDRDLQQLEQREAQSQAVRHLSAEAGLKQLDMKPGAQERRLGLVVAGIGGEKEGGVKGGRFMSKAKQEQNELDWRVKRSKQRKKQKRKWEKTGQANGKGETKGQRFKRLSREQQESKRLRVEMEEDENGRLQHVPQKDRLNWSVDYDRKANA